MSHYEISVFIGRFQPYHIGHYQVIKKALEVSDTVAIFIGSADKSRSARNPFTAEEREQMIRASLKEHFTSEYVSGRIEFFHLNDQPYNLNGWVEDVQNKVNTLADMTRIGRNAKVTLIGYNKDKSSFYLSLFPQWDTTEVPVFESKLHTSAGYAVPVDATWIRERWYEHNLVFCEDLISDYTRRFLQDMYSTEEYRTILSDHQHIREYKDAWKETPFPPTFNTVDAVVVQAGHILVVERKDSPGKGLLALPGGFVDEYETLQDAVIRELYQETRIDVPRGTLSPRIKAVQTFDDPYRSERGRTITRAFLFDLSAEINRQVAQGKKPRLTTVKGGDDAAMAYWKPIADLKANEFFEDHYHIIHAMLDLANERY